LSEIGDTSTLANNLKSSVAESARALGINDFTNLTDANMK